MNAARIAPAVALALAALVFAGCGGSQDPSVDESDPAPGVRGAPLEGEAGDGGAGGNGGGSAGVATADESAPEPAGAQDADAEQRELVQRFIEIARTGPPAKRPQAAQRLGGMGAPAVAALTELAGETPRELAALGPDLLRPLAELGDPHLRGLLWRAVEDPNFPYRPAATQWLATTAVAAEWPRFEALLSDPLSAVRAAAVEAPRTLDDRDLEPHLVAALDDRRGNVRRAAADVLVDWGHDWALRWLLEELARDDRFFELETGKAARYEAARLLRAHLDDRDLFGFEPGEAPDAPGNLDALDRVRQAVVVRASADDPSPPPHARASDVAVDGVLGLELRSCRRGEFFVAVTETDRLVVGIGRPDEYQLAPGAADRLAALVRARYDGEQEQTLYGELGCDLEAYRLTTSDGTPLVIRVMKGPEEVDDLRPAVLDEIARALLAEVPEDVVWDHRVDDDGEFGAGRDSPAVELEAALESVGGDLRGGARPPPRRVRTA